MQTKALFSTVLASALVLSAVAPIANAAYNADTGYEVGSGFSVTSTQLFNDGVIPKGTKKAQYDDSSKKKGTITFSGSDKQTKSVTDIFGTSITYEGVVDYVGKTGAPFTFKVSVGESTNYFTYILGTASNTVNLSVDNGSNVNPAFAVEGSGGVAYAVDCGILSEGVHTITIDGTSGSWCPDIAAVAVYPMSGENFKLPYQNESLSFEERAADLVARMTLPEKISQLGHNAPAIARLGVASYYYWREGAHGVARQGKATSFPVSLAMSNTWDPELYGQAAAITSTEARAKNNRYDLNYWSPTINLSRDPRWGRNEESLGEDPYLTTQFGGAFVNGMQGGDDKYIKTIATVKHFLANNCEGERQTGTSEMSESELRDYYAKAFQGIVENTAPGAIMSSYNATTVTRNGEKLWDYIAMPANKTILTDYLRRSWGFDGFVTGDCGAVADLNGNAFKRALFDSRGDSRPLSSIDQSETVGISIQAGNEMDCGAINTAYGVEAVERGYVSEDDVDVAVFRIFLERFRTGEFDDTTTFRTYTADDIETEESVAAAEKAAEESWVMLENDGILPISKDVKKVAVVGEFANKLVLGDYTGEPEKTVTPIEGITAELGKNGADVQLLGGVPDSEKLFNVKSLSFVMKNGSVKVIDLSKAENVSGMELTDGSLMNVTQKASAVIKNVDFKDVQSVKAEMATGELWGGTLSITYGAGGPSVASISSKATADANTYVECSAEYTGDDGGYNATADLYISASAAIKDFQVAPFKSELDAADVIIAYASTIPKQEGLGSQDASESHDRASIDLPAHEAHVQTLCDAYPEKTVVVMTTSGQINVAPFKDKCRAILWNSYNGQMQGTALGKILSGEVNPSGKLSTTWYDPADLNIMTVNGTKTTSKDTNGTTNITWQRNKYTLTQEYDDNGKCTWPGRTYMYYNGTPEYPFGYGLSYTNYTYSDLAAESSTVHAGDKVKVTLNVTNSGIGQSGEAKAELMPTESGRAKAYTAVYNNGVLSKVTVSEEMEITAGVPVEIAAPAGAKVMLWGGETGMKPMSAAASSKNQSATAVDGTEIVEVYASYNDADGTDIPLQQLVGFARVDLKAGETKPVELELDTNTLARWSEQEVKNYIPAGTYTIYAGKNAADQENFVEITIDGEIESRIKTVYAVPTGISVTGAYSAETGSTEAIKTISPQLSVVMTDESVYDLANAEIQYTSSNEAVATVDADGTVRAGVETGVATITAEVTINGETKSTSFPVVCELQDAIPSEERALYLEALDAAYAEYDEAFYREDFWAELTGIYNNARATLSTEVDSANLSMILEDAKAAMGAIRDHLKEGEQAYSITITPDWYRNAEIKVTYNGDEDMPEGKLVVTINDEPTEYECTANMTEDCIIKLTELAYDDAITAYVEGLSDTAAVTIAKPPAHVEYNLADERFDKLGALAKGEPMEEVNGIGGYGSFNTISNVNYSVSYNGKSYKLTGGFQGGKGNCTNATVYFKPFDCYKKATVTVFFDSATEDRRMRIAQDDGTKNGRELGILGGAGNRNIQTLTVTTEDMENPIYIQPQTKESFYMIIVDYE